MCTNTYTANETTFWKFISDYKIEIPIIQRDYAQGRLGKEHLRKSFLTNLKQALDGDLPNGEKKLKLDFVYGSTEKDKMFPLDGQQRLTTLWLLHWYIALMAEKLDKGACENLKKFSYETRITSREFYKELCNPNNFSDFYKYKPYESRRIVSYIKSRTWFYSAWNQDPTIQSMLRILGGTKITDKKGEDILDGIEEMFNCSFCTYQENAKCFFKHKTICKSIPCESKEVLCMYNKYWALLTGNDCPIIFYHFPLKDFGLSDDLYIKMNARGKQLTSFENFKADLIDYITNQAEDESLEGSVRAEWKKLIDPESGIPKKIDTDWTDIFWKNKSKGLTDNESKTRKSNQIDEIYFAFLNRFFWNELFIAKNSDDKFILDIGKGDENSTQENNNLSYKYLNNSAHDNDATIAYEGLEFYRYDNGEIPLSFFQKLKRIMDNYLVYSKGNDLPECPWNTSFRFIPKYTVENDNNIEITNNANDKILCMSTLNQVQRIVFFAICKFFDHDNNIKDNVLSLKRWMRVVWNLVSGEDHNGRPEIRSTSAMRTAIEHINSLDPHNVYNSLTESNISGTTSFAERWKEEIDKAKQILNGTKRQDGKSWEEIIIEAENYAFFKGAIRFLFQDENGDVNWDNFDTKWENAKSFFYEKYKTNKNLLRTFISYFDSMESFKVIYYDNEHWKSALLDKKLVSHIHKFLLKGQICDFDNYSSSISDDKKLKIVQEQLVKTPILEKIEQIGYYMEDGYNLHVYYANRNSDIYLGRKNRDFLINDSINPKNKLVDNCKIFYGNNIYFNFKENYTFLWRNDEQLLLLENVEPDKYWIKDDKETEETKKYYCFKVEGNMEPEEFIKKLDKLIDQAENDQNAANNDSVTTDSDEKQESQS